MSAESYTPKRLHLGCGKTILAGWVNLDLLPGEGVDVVADLDKCGEVPLPFEADTFDEFMAAHLFEHIRNPLPFMQELHRVAKPGAKAVLRWMSPVWPSPRHLLLHLIHRSFRMRASSSPMGRKGRAVESEFSAPARA